MSEFLSAAALAWGVGFYGLGVKFRVLGLIGFRV